jgi:predicted nucleic acid-binding protein
MRDAAGAWRFVPDTNVCLDLFVFEDPRCASLLAAVGVGEVQLITREDCRAEWLAVLAYPKLQLDDARRNKAREVFDRYVQSAPAAQEPADRAVLPRCRDRDDQKFLQLALQVGAAALLTRDAQLLRLARRTQRDGLFAILPPTAWRRAIGG